MWARVSQGGGATVGGCEGSRVRADYTIWRVSSLLFRTSSAAHLRPRGGEAEEAKNIKFAWFVRNILVGR